MDRRYYDIINDILSRPQKKPTREEAVKALIRCGIMDENGKIKDVYKEILESFGEDDEQQS